MHPGGTGGKKDLAMQSFGVLQQSEKRRGGWEGEPCHLMPVHRLNSRFAGTYHRQAAACRPLECTPALLAPAEATYLPR